MHKVFPISPFQVSSSLVVSGPLWTGPLHDATYLMDMLDLAKQWGWVDDDGTDNLGKLIKLMIDESDPKLPFGYIKLDEVLFLNDFVASYLCGMVNLFIDPVLTNCFK